MKLIFLSDRYQSHTRINLRSIEIIFRMMLRFLSTCRKPLLVQRPSTSITTCQCIRRRMSWYHNSFLSTKPSITVMDGHDIRSLLRRAEPFSTVSISSTTDGQTNTDNTKNNQSNKNDSKDKKKDDSNIFLDNLGKIFLSTIALVLLSLYRSNKGNNAKAALREEIEATALLDPLEIEDLRYSNDHLIKEVYDDIVKEFVGKPSTMVTYGQFMKSVLTVLRRRYGEGATIQFGHLMDRVVVKELERIANENRASGDDLSREVEVPVSFLLTALSLAMNSTVADRVQALYNVMLLEQSSAEQTVSINEVQRMVQHLQSTCQLVPDAQIVPTISNIPYQTYRVGNGAELTKRACESLNLIDGENKSDRSDSSKMGETVALEDFYAILKSRSVCAWGECYVKKKDRMATSDR